MCDTEPALPGKADLLVAPEKRASVTWKGLAVTAPQKGGKPDKVLLSNCVGHVEPFHFVALMGPSGSGKTTLLDVLAGRKPSNLQASGEILVNGHATKLSYGTVSYVPQHDVLTGTLTVRETLSFTAALRLKQTAAERERTVSAVMLQMGLTTAANTPVGTVFIKGLSGGQKRRLSIGCELITSPSIMFLDEPTSGLDSASAFYCMQALRAIVQEGRTVFMSIHQPSAEVFDLFDQLLLLSEGRQIYFGSAAGAETFYERCALACPAHRALADHYIFCLNADFKKQQAEFVAGPALGAAAASDVMERADGNRIAGISIDHGSALERLTKEFEATLRAGIEGKVDMLKQAGASSKQYYGFRNEVNPASQFVTLTHRMLLNCTRDIGVFWLRLGMYLGLCVCLGTVYWQMGSNWNIVQSRGGLIFFVVSFLTFMSVSSFPAFIFVNERLNGYYGVAPYTLASTVASLPFLAIMSLLCSVVVYFLSGLNTAADRFFYFVLALFTVLVVAESLMMAIAAVVPHYLIGLAAGAAIMGCFMPIAGYIIPTGQIPAPFWRYPMHYVAFHTYSIHGLMLNEFEDTDGWGCPCAVVEGGCSDPNCTIRGEQVLSALEWNMNRSEWIDLIILAAMIVAYRLLFFGMLKLREALSK